MRDKPTFNATKVEMLSKNDSGIELAIGRICNRRISPFKIDAKKFGRRQPMTIKNRENGCKTLLFAMGDNLAMDTIAMDYDSRTALGLQFGSRDVDLVVSPATRIEVIRHYLNHPHLGNRLGIQLGFLGALLGALSFIDTLVGLVAALF